MAATTRTSTREAGRTATRSVYDALKYAGYDVKFVLGDGPHSGRHGASILPDVLRWLWRDYPKPIAQPAVGRWPLNEAWISGRELGACRRA